MAGAGAIDGCVDVAGWVRAAAERASPAVSRVSSTSRARTNLVEQAFGSLCRAFGRVPALAPTLKAIAMTTTTATGLFDPIEIAGVRLANRLMMAPMGSCQSDEAGYITDQSIAYYRRRAQGGVGAITVESVLVDPETRGHEPRLHGPEFVPGLRRVAEAISQEGVVPGLQLMHPGRQVMSGAAKAPSPVPLNSIAPPPDELTEAEIEQIFEQYVRAAMFAEEAGYAYVEVHGAHGYLPSDFLSPVVNRRADRYGGDAERRRRFVTELAAAISDAVAIPLFWRLSAEEHRPGGYTIDDQIEVALALQAAGVKCLSISAGTWHALGVTIAPMYVARGHMVEYAAQVKQAVEIPVIAVGRLDDPTLAASVLAEGAADIILLGRGLLADPDWPRKVREGRLEELRPCIACNACVDLVAVGKDVRCAVNPETGRELTWRCEPTDRVRRVMVIGAGPAGMELARLARLRGHDVSVWEREQSSGGKLDVASRAPSKAEVRRFHDFETQALRRLGVEVHTGVEVDAGLVAEQDPDVVVIASGADPLLPAIEGIDQAIVVDAQELLLDRLRADPGRSVVVVGGSATGCETAELLVQRRAKVTMVEMLGSVGQGIEQITRRKLVGELRRAGVLILTRHQVVRIEPGQVICRSLEDGAEVAVEADIVALATGWSPRGAALAATLGQREVVVIGDADSPGDFVAATGAAARVALAL